MKLSTYIKALNEIEGLLPKGVDPDVVFGVSVLYGNCLVLNYTDEQGRSCKVEVRPTDDGIAVINTTYMERKDQ